jgi:NADH dehydrogenase
MSRGARAIAEAARAAGVQRLIHMSGIGAESRSSKNRYVLSKVEAEDAIIGAFEAPRSCGPACFSGPTT